MKMVVRVFRNCLYNREGGAFLTSKGTGCFTGTKTGYGWGTLSGTR